MNFKKPTTRGQGIKKLSNLFDKYKNNLRAPQGSVETACIEVVDELIGVQLRADQVSYNPSQRCLYITARGPLKSEVLQHKKDILAHLAGRLGAASAPKEMV